MKRTVRLLLLAALLVLLLCVSAFAAEVTDAGFYNIGSAAGVTVTAAASDGETGRFSADVDGQDGYETLYAGSDKLQVEVSGLTAGQQCLVLLVTGDGTSITEDTICYIDQKAPETGKTSVTFDVYPMLPGETEKMTLIVTGSGGFTRKDIPMGYAEADNSRTAAPFTPGDVNEDGDIDSLDALMILQHSVGIITLNQTQFSAADVVADSSADALDALAILQYSVGIIKSFS